jgi:hypothetical protein
MLDNNYDPSSIFSELEMFYQKLIQITMQRCPGVFKRNELLYPWHSKMGKSLDEFR